MEKQKSLSKLPTLDTEPQETNDCGERENYPLPEMSRVTGYPIKRYINNPQQKWTEKSVFIYLYTCIYIYIIYNYMVCI